LCDIFAEFNKLSISLQGPDKHMLDVSAQVAGFIKNYLCRRKI